MTTNSAAFPLRVATACALLLLATACQRKTPGDEASRPAEPAAAATAPAPAAAPVAAGDEVPPGALRAHVWACADGQKLVMRNLFREKAIAIDFHDGTRRLEQTVSASGARYADAVVTFWSKGGSARLERKGAPAVQCEELRVESLREDARVRGVRYRAVGNEPGWELELGPGTRLTWITNFGEQRYDFAAAQATVAADGASVFTAQQGTSAIRATLRPETCVDDGEVEYDHAAIVEFEGATFRGCGNRLDRR
jgi:membrane-bound inhibitor of C-type lysozyme